MKSIIDVQGLIAESPNRRRFVANLGIAGVAAVSVAKMKGQSMSGVTDVDIVNFALNLEYLEAEFYTISTQGKTIDQVGIGIDGAGTPGSTSGGKLVAFADAPNYMKEAAWQIGEDERAHVTLLRGALSAAGAPFVSKPAINLNALGFGFGDYREFFDLARIFEDIGVSAYGGAAPLLTSKDILGAAARILAAEAEHVGIVRLQVACLILPTTALDGLDIIPPPSGTRLASLDSNGLSAVRTPGQVLALAYGAPNANCGGFFPNGVNGALNMSTSPAKATIG